MTLADVARRTFEERRAEGWLTGSLAVGGALVLLLLVAFLLPGNGGPLNVGVVAGVAAFVMPMLSVAAIAAAMDPVDAPGLPRAERVTGAFAGTTATILPGALLLVVFLFVMFTVRGGLQGALVPLLVLVLALALATAAWVALGLAFTARSPSLARAVTASAIGATAIVVLVPLAINVAAGVYGASGAAGGAEFWRALGAYASPTQLAGFLVRAATPGSQPVFGATASALDSGTGFAIGLVAWLLVPFAIAVALAADEPALPPPAPAAPTPGAPDATASEPGAPPHEW